jgi:selenocysteine lyase/cysteine desulfurase
MSAASRTTPLTSTHSRDRSPENPALSGGVVIIEVPKESQKTVADTLYTNFGIAASTTGGLRLCPHIYNTRAHIMRATDGVASVRDLIKA